MKATIPCNLKCYNGNCIIENDKPKCNCSTEFTGQYCQHYVCSNYCQNNGKCHVENNNQPNNITLKCMCPKDWTGDKCEIPMDTCLVSFCNL